jgi:hypothetical protein
MVPATTSSLAAALRVGLAEFVVRPGIAEVPGELHACDLDLHGVRTGGLEAFGCPDGAALQVQPDKKDRGQRGPDDLELGITVRVTRLFTILTIAVAPGEISKAALGKNKDDAHDDEGPGELVVDAGGGGGHARGQPPRLGDEEIRADEGDQPDDRQESETHGRASESRACSPLSGIDLSSGSRCYHKSV